MVDHDDDAPDGRCLRQIGQNLIDLLAAHGNETEVGAGVGREPFDDRKLHGVSPPTHCVFNDRPVLPQFAHAVAARNEDNIITCPRETYAIERALDSSAKNENSHCDYPTA